MINNRIQRFSAIEYCLILLCFTVCLTGALLLPVNQCPDEFVRDHLITWMLEHGTLPTGDELETFALNPPPGENYGFSYALRPYLPAIVGALFTKAAAVFTGSPRVLLLATRMCSVFSVTGCCCFCLLIGRKIFEKRSSSILFAALVCFLPQVMFLGMYHNNDSLTLFAVSMMLYYLVEGYERKWPVRCCIGLAVAFSLGLLSYYSIYGWILMCAVFCVLAVLKDPAISDKGRLILKRAGLIGGICLLLAGWFFIRGAILHNGDFLGIAYEEVSRARVEALGYKLYTYVCYRRDGLSMLEFFRVKNYEWLRMTARSFVGVFSNLNLFLPKLLYVIYYAIFAFGILLMLAVRLRRRPFRRDRLLMLVMIVSVGISFALHFWQSYARDYQPQGRYIISAIVPLAYMISYGMDNCALLVPQMKNKEPASVEPAAALTVLWLFLFAWACLGTMTKMLP